MSDFEDFDETEDGGGLVAAGDLIDATLREIKRAYLVRQFRLKNGDLREGD